MYICYVEMEGGLVPIICEEICKSEMFEDHVVLKETRLLEDNVLPILEISELSIKSKQIKYYVHGSVKDENKGIFDALKKSKERELKKIKDDEEVDTFIDKKEEIEQIKKKRKTKSDKN